MRIDDRWRYAVMPGGLLMTLLVALLLSHVAARHVAQSASRQLLDIANLIDSRSGNAHLADGQHGEKTVRRERVSSCNARPRGWVKNRQLGGKRSRSLRSTGAVGRITKHSLKPTGGLVASRAVVKAAVRAGVRPSAVLVSSTSEHPAGLLVTGWQSAGAGFRDGDIVVTVAGAPARSVGQVVGAVVSAYEHKTYAVSGIIWRRGRALSALVELPIPRARRTAPRSASSSSASTAKPRRPRAVGKSVFEPKVGAE